MKIIGLVFSLFVAGVASAQTNQSWAACRHPIRSFGEHKTVNLTPLFQWWQQQPVSRTTGTNADASADAERPLSAWHRVAGIKAGELETSWVVDAAIYTSPADRTNARIILNNPPTAEEQTFNALKTQLAQTAQQITNAQRAYKAGLKAAQKAEDEARSYRRSGTKHATESSNNFLRQAAQDREAVTAAQNQQKQLEAALPQIQKQLNAIPSKKGRYLIDWFALELGKSKQGVPIYDVGTVPPDSP